MLSFLIHQAEAAVPTAAQLAGYVSTTTNTSSDYLFASVFDGGILTFSVVIALLAAVLYFVWKGLRRILG